MYEPVSATYLSATRVKKEVQMANGAQFPAGTVVAQQEPKTEFRSGSGPLI